ncbi:MAG: hypothetical protein ABIH90_02005 [Candidatus Aenigmatarchaeota archaeon]
MAEMALLEILHEKISLLASVLWPQYISPNIGGIIYMFSILISGYILGKLIRWAIVKVLRKTALKKLTQRTWGESILRITGYKDVIDLIGGTVKWFVYVLFMAAAITGIGIPVLGEFLTRLSDWMPSLLTAIIIMILGFVVSDFFGRIFEEAGRKFLRDEGIAKFGGGLVKYTLAMVMVNMALSLLGLETSSLLVLLGGMLAGSLIMLSFALKDVLPNIMAAMQLRSLLKVGEEIEIDGWKGRVESVSTLGVTLVAGKKKMVLPNKMVMGKVVVRNGR